MKKHIALVLALATSGYGASAQKALRIAPGQMGMYPTAVEFVPGQEPEFVRGTVLLKQQDAFVRTSDVVLQNEEKDLMGQEHFRYQQTINNIPVDGAVYAVHVSAGKIKSQNGVWLSDVPAELPAKPSISESTALKAAMNAFGAKSYKWQLPEEEAFIKAETGDANATFKPKGELTYYSDENKVSSKNIRLAYKFDLYAQEPLGRRIYFVDAKTGEILAKREIMHTVNVVGTANTAHSGARAITTDSYNGSYRLRETTRGNGIETYNLAQGYNYSAATDFTDADNYWSNFNSNKDQYATDAHWAAEMTYDYYKHYYNRNSIDNNGFAIKSYVHYGVNQFNAMWDGARMIYGDGSAANNYVPMTSVDICGHEITHGLTARTANLNYSYESGALNEGFSDIFGFAVEIYAKPTQADWNIGDGYTVLRSLSNPKAYGQPDCYQGINWATGTADAGGVHTNSGVLNRWFYLLSQGGSGVNDKNFSYSVSPVYFYKACDIAYRALTVYLTQSSQYSDARAYTIQAATDLFGANSYEVQQVVNAWNAVNVSAAAPPPACSDNYELPTMMSNNLLTLCSPVSTNTDIFAKLGSPGDKDYYVITTTASAPKLKVTLEDLPGNYQLKLYDANGVQLGKSEKCCLLDESIAYNGASSAATYKVYVYGMNSAYSTTACYKLRISTSAVNQLRDDGDDTEQGLPGDITLSNDQMTVFPNPATDKITVSFGAEEAGAQTISITDLVGRVIDVKTFDVQEGINTFTLPLESYRGGMYFLQMPGRPAVKFQVSE
jgi:Zn-dependent metalloprotease